jgi:hypothetical protein
MSKLISNLLEKRFTHFAVVMVVLMTAALGQGAAALHSSKPPVDCSEFMCHGSFGNCPFGCVCSTSNPRVVGVCLTR